jgi:signal transduction histidine kinase
MYVLRMRQQQKRLRLLLETKHAERGRIARELHDTLMQGMHGLVLQLQSWPDDQTVANDRRTETA